jgi:recombination protein RecT
MPGQARTAGPSTAVAQRGEKTVGRLLDRYAADLTAIMPRHTNVETFMGLAVDAVRRDKKLRAAADANPASLIFALRRCAYLGHVPIVKQFYLVPFPSNKAGDGGWTVVGIEAWQGAVQRLYRAGGIDAVKVNLGRAGDAVLRWNPTTMTLPHHEYDEFAAPIDRGPLKAAYAWAVMPGGAISHVAWLPEYEIERRKAQIRSEDRLAAFWGLPGKPEGPNTAAMWRKSALLALEDMLPISAEYLADRTARAYRAGDGQFADLGPVAGADDDPDEPWEGEVMGDATES